MTIEILLFADYSRARTAKQQKLGEWRALHNDIMEDGRIRITFVNGDDDPNNSEEVENRRIIFARKQELTLKLKDDSMTFSEWKEYSILKDNL